MSILKFQQGAALPAYIHYTPVVSSNSNAAAASAASAEAASSGKKPEGITDKDLVKALDSLDALPNEVKQITLEILNFIVDTLMSLGDTNPAQMSLRYAALVGKMKIAKFNAKQFENAYDLIKSNGGLTSIAIDTDGYIFCRSRENPEDYERLSPEEYIANYKDYKAVTNQELLNLRAQSPGLVDNNEILKVVSNGIGITGVQKMINDAISKIGTTTMQQQGYTQTLQAQIARGVEYIEEAAKTAGENVTNGMQVDGIYNLGVLSKDLLVQAQFALNYIYSTLPKNAKALLTVSAAENGVPGGAKGLINQLIQSKLDFTQTEKLQRSNNPSDKKGKGKTTEVPEGVDPAFAKLALTPVMMAQLGLSERKIVLINLGSSYSASCYAQVVPIVSKTGESIGANSTLLDISQSQLSGALNLEDATMGGARISQDAIRKVAITSGNMYIMSVPIDKNRPDGVIAPDLKYLKKVEAAEREVETWKAAHSGLEITADVINGIYKKHSLPLLMDSLGNINVTDYCKFAVFNGEVKDKYLIPPPDGSDIIALDITSEENVLNYKDILSGNKEVKKQEEFDFNEWYDINGHDTLYRATIFVPLSTNVLSGAATSGASLTVGDAVGIYAKNEQKERLKHYDADRASKFYE